MKKIVFAMVAIIATMVISCVDAPNTEENIVLSRHEEGGNTDAKDLITGQSEEEDILAQEEFQREMEWEREKWHMSFEEILHWREPSTSVTAPNYGYILTNTDLFTITFNTGFVTRSGKPKSSEFEFYILKWENEKYLGMEYIKCGARCENGYYHHYNDEGTKIIVTNMCALCMGTGLMKNDEIGYTIAFVDRRLFNKFYPILRECNDSGRYKEMEAGIYITPWVKDSIQFVINTYNKDVIQNGEPAQGWYMIEGPPVETIKKVY